MPLIEASTVNNFVNSAIFYTFFACEPLPLWVKPVRLLGSFLFGLLLSLILWEMVAMHINMNVLFAVLFPRLPIFTLFLFLNALSFMISRSVRTFTLLLFVSFCGQSGISYLRAWAFALVISGPINILLANAGEVARVFSCSTQLTYNLTKTRFDLMAKPFTNTLQDMKEDIHEIQDSFKHLQILLDDLKFAVEHEDRDDDLDPGKYRRTYFMNVSHDGNYTESNQKSVSASEIQDKLIRGIRNQCKRQLGNGYKVCNQVFDQGFEKCATNFPESISNSICWPYRVDIICKVNMFANPDKVCDISKVLTPDFGKYYIKLLQSERELFENSSSIQISYKKHNVTTSALLRSAQKTSEAFLLDYGGHREKFNLIMLTIERFLYGIIILLTYSAIRYFWRFRFNVEYDNFYITNYFRHLDQRRKIAKRTSVFPLSYTERAMYVDVFNLYDNISFKKKNKYSGLLLMILSLEIIPAFLFTVLSCMFSSLLCAINNCSLVTYNQEGEHEVRFRINGTGLMARLLRTTMKNFNIHERVSTSLTNVECLPVALTLPHSFYVKIILIYIMILIVAFKGGSLLIMRRVICRYFYPKREKQRIQYLYGLILRSRKSKHSELLRQLAERNMSRTHVLGKSNIFMVLYVSYPNRFGWLRNYKCTKCNCLICCAEEDDKFVFCSKCKYPYCSHCHKEMSEVCVFCGTTIEISHEEDIDADDNDEPEGEEENNNEQNEENEQNEQNEQTSEPTTTELTTNRKKK